MVTKAAGLSGLQGGLTVSVASAAGGLIASHILFDPTTGMSAIMKTFDGDPAEQPRVHTLRAPMMALSAPDPVLAFPPDIALIPQLFLRNTTAQPLNTTLALAWRTPVKSGRLTLPPTTLAPGEVRVLNLADSTSQAQMPADASWGTVVLQYEGRSGDLVPIATSFDASGRYGLQTPFSELTAHLLKGSMWHVDLTHDSLITTGNGGNTPIRAALTLFYNSGRGSYTMEKLLAPGEQMWADVGQIIRDQAPDKDGKTIPTDVMMGSYELRDLDHLSAGSLNEGKLVLDRTWGHGYYGCTICCGYHASKLNPNPFSGLIGTGGSDQAQAEDCSNTWYDFTGIATNWASSNTGVATVANAYTNLVGVGKAKGSAHLQLASTNIHTNCPVVLFVPQNPVTTTPTVSVTAGPTAIVAFHTGASSPQSASVNITAASNPSSGGTFQWATTSSKISLSNQNSATVTVSAVADQWSTSAGDISVTVTYTFNGITSNPATTTITILKPTGLTQTSSTLNATGHTCNSAPSANKCTSSTYTDTGGPYTYTSYVRTIKGSERESDGTATFT